MGLGGQSTILGIKKIRRNIFRWGIFQREGWILFIWPPDLHLYASWKHEKDVDKINGKGCIPQTGEGIFLREGWRGFFRKCREIFRRGIFQGEAWFFVYLTAWILTALNSPAWIPPTPETLLLLKIVHHLKGGDYFQELYFYFGGRPNLIGFSNLKIPRIEKSPQLGGIHPPK